MSSGGTGFMDHPHRSGSLRQENISTFVIAGQKTILR